MSLGNLLFLLGKLFIMAGIGVVLHKTGIVDDGFQKKLSNLLIKAAFPLSILAIGNSAFDRSVGGNLLVVGIVALCYYPLALLAGNAMARLGKLPESKAMPFAITSTFPNCAFIGLPLVAELLGPEGSIYAVIFTLGFQLFLFTVGPRLLGGVKISVKNLLTQPFTLAPILAILIFVSPFRLPALLVTSLEQVGAMATPLSMIIIGGYLATIELKSLFSDTWVWLNTALRLVVYPAVLGAVLYIGGIRGTMAMVCLLLSALPPATMGVVLVRQYNRDVLYGVRAVVLGTGLMLLTLPCIAQIGSKVFL